jgi:hypothetical protein
MNGSQNFIHLSNAFFIFEIDSRVKVGNLVGQSPHGHHFRFALVCHLDGFNDLIRRSFVALMKPSAAAGASCSSAAAAPAAATSTTTTAAAAPSHVTTKRWSHIVNLYVSMDCFF